MKKILIGLVAAVAILVFFIPQFFEASITKEADSSLTSEINQKRFDSAASANAEKSRPYIENRILGISHLASTYANSSLKLPTKLKDKIVGDQQILSDTKAGLDEVITFLNEGNIDAANTAYRLIQTKTLEANLAAEQRSKKIKADFRAALNEFYSNGLVYKEDEWENLKQGIRSNLTDRSTEAARKVYLMQPADNLPISYLQEQLETLGEHEQLLFFYQMNYEIYYQLLKNYGSLSAALDYGLALFSVTKQSEEAIAVLKGPITQIISDPKVDAFRYKSVLSTYLSALKAQGKSQGFEQFSQTIIDSVRNNITTLDAQVPSTSNAPKMALLVKAEFRTEAAGFLSELDLLDEAILLVEDARNIYVSVDTRKVVEMDRLIEQYQLNQQE